MENKNERSASHNDQTHPHHEGQQQNKSAGNARDNNSHEVEEMKGGREGVRDTAESFGRQPGAAENETESDRANKNEDEGVRGGQSSV